MTDREGDRILARFLRGGSFTGILLMFLGLGVLSLTGRIESLHTFPAGSTAQILTLLKGGDSLGLLNLGVLLLAITPAVSVIVCAVTFYRQKLAEHALASVIVLGILLFSMIAL